jgi:hypothetical protein
MHRPGMLQLCYGMPVMVKHNVATECCVTNGAEATIAGWKYSQISKDTPVLDVLFVKLTNPAVDVQLDGLPKNVVPITRSVVSTKCNLPNDQQVIINRDQVRIVPNFAMTDYGSQGRTRPDNVVELMSCKTHQSYYTALSRSSTADGTAIVQGFNADLITKGASGWLRQEFRELELLDEITKLKYQHKLPVSIDGHRRNTVIRQYQLWKGTKHVPQEVHKALHWDNNDPFNMVYDIEDSEWELIKSKRDTFIGNIQTHTNISDYRPTKRTKTNESEYTKARGSQTLATISNDKGQRQKNNISHSTLGSQVKRKCTEILNDKQVSKRVKLIAEDETTFTNQAITDTLSPPLAIKWDSIWWSCAYDCVFTILYDLWKHGDRVEYNTLASHNLFWNSLTCGFYDVLFKRKTLEDIRDQVRFSLHSNYPDIFQQGNVGTSINQLCETIFNIGNQQQV